MAAQIGWKCLYLMPPITYKWMALQQWHNHLETKFTYLRGMNLPRKQGIIGAVSDGLEQPLGNHLNPPGESLKFIPAQQSQNLNQGLIKLTIPAAAGINRVVTEFKFSVLMLRKWKIVLEKSIQLVSDG